MARRKRRLREEALLKSADFEGFVKEFADESDRATAVLAGALLDEHLYQVLTEYLVDDPREVAQLLDTEQPLGTFGSRIRAAYCMGLLTREAFETLTIIKTIRNAFAHRLHGLSFDHTDISRECDKLRALDRMEMPWKNRDVFLSAALSVRGFLRATKEAIRASERRCRVVQVEVLFDSRVANARRNT